jgi:hypothetical protein
MDSREHEHQEGRLSIYGMVEVYASDDTPESRGWVSTISGPTDVVDNRNDVQPLFQHELPLDGDALNELDDVLSQHTWEPGMDEGFLHSVVAADWDRDGIQFWQYSVTGYIRHYMDGVVQECRIDPRHPLREGIVRLMAANAVDVELRDLVWDGDGWEIDGMDWQKWRDGITLD